jgi:hypothetical protein
MFRGPSLDATLVVFMSIQITRRFWSAAFAWLATHAARAASDLPTLESISTARFGARRPRPATRVARVQKCAMQISLEASPVRTMPAADACGSLFFF